MEAPKPFVLCDNLVKIYKVADLEVVALQGLDLEVRAGEIMALIGPSGAGKSTLLNVIGGLDVPSAGRVQVGGWDLLAMKDADRVRYKQEVVGFVWQQPSRNLLPYLSARENVEMPLLISGKPGRARRARALELLEIVGLSERADFRPDRLSGGEQQRVARLCCSGTSSRAKLIRSQPRKYLRPCGASTRSTIPPSSWSLTIRWYLAWSNVWLPSGMGAPAPRSVVNATQKAETCSTRKNG